MSFMFRMKLSLGNLDDKLKRIGHFLPGLPGVRMFAPRTLGTRMAKGSGRLIVRSLSEDSTSVFISSVDGELYAKAILMSIKTPGSRISFAGTGDFQTEKLSMTIIRRKIAESDVNACDVCDVCEKSILRQSRST